MVKLYSWQKSFLIGCASILNYASAYTVLFLWNNAFFCFVALAFSSFLMGAVLARPGYSEYLYAVLYSNVMQVLGAVISIGIVVVPALMYGAGFEIFDIAVLWYGSTLAKMLFVSLPLCTILALLGSFVAEAIA